MAHEYRTGDIVTELDPEKRGLGIWLMVENTQGIMHSICLASFDGRILAQLNAPAHPRRGNMKVITNIQTIVPMLLEIADELTKSS